MTKTNVPSCPEEGTTPVSEISVFHCKAQLVSKRVLSSPENEHVIEECIGEACIRKRLDIPGVITCSISFLIKWTFSSISLCHIEPMLPWLLHQCTHDR